jgi:hypothetical protein
MWMQSATRPLPELNCRNGQSKLIQADPRKQFPLRALAVMREFDQQMRMFEKVQNWILYEYFQAQAAANEPRMAELRLRAHQVEREIHKFVEAYGT